MEAELNFLTTAQKPLLETSSWVKSWTDSVEYWFGSKPLKPPPQIELVEHTGGIHELPEDNTEMLGGHEDAEAEWGADDDLPGGLEAEDLNLGVKPPPPPWGAEAWVQ